MWGCREAILQVSGLQAGGVQLIAGPQNKEEEALLRLVSVLALQCHWTAALPLL